MRALTLDGQRFLLGQGPDTFLITHPTWPLSGEGPSIADAVRQLHQAMVDIVTQRPLDADPEMTTFILGFLNRP